MLSNDTWLEYRFKEVYIFQLNLVLSKLYIYIKLLILYINQLSYLTISTLYFDVRKSCVGYVYLDKSYM